MQLLWSDFDEPLCSVAVTRSATRTLWHDGEQFVCDWHETDKPIEQWLINPVPDLAAAKAVVDSWETPQGWEDADEE